MKLNFNKKIICTKASMSKILAGILFVLSVYAFRHSFFCKKLHKKETNHYK